MVSWVVEGGFGVDASPLGFKGDAGGGSAHPPETIGVADLDKSFWVFPAFQASKTIPCVWTMAGR